MLCDICHKNMATVHLTEIVNDKVVEMHICQKCAKSKAEELKNQLSISELLSGLMDIEGISETRPALKCPVCGMSYADFKKQGRLGCENCYATFKDRLFPLLRKVHGTTRHSGKVPGAVAKVSASERLEELKKRLERAIEMEEYEEAARLRDEIKKAEKKSKDK
ncbi:MAG: UvrB/UvrC motif-containing protein [Candidatus Omnitrophota bacterium]|nr:MAG: UvrB/UvrC motif-containing protein [Candidatus Omnitrophota bacterium]